MAARVRQVVVMLEAQLLPAERVEQESMVEQEELADAAELLLQEVGQTVSLETVILCVHSRSSKISFSETLRSL
jgi:hypothetical protein